MTNRTPRLAWTRCGGAAFLALALVVGGAAGAGLPCDHLAEGLISSHWGRTALAEMLADLTLRQPEVGQIRAGYRYGWAESLGWADFHGLGGGVRVGSNLLSGWIRIEKIGPVHLGNGQPRDGYQYSNRDHLDYGINNDGEGNLSGWGWGANFGWISFQGVRIDREGNFSGSAFSNQIGRIFFQGSTPTRFAVKTDPYPWAKLSQGRSLWAGQGAPFSPVRITAPSPAGMMLLPSSLLLPALPLASWALVAEGGMGRQHQDGGRLKLGIRRDSGPLERGPPQGGSELLGGAGLRGEIRAGFSAEYAREIDALVVLFAGPAQPLKTESKFVPSPAI